MAADKYEEEGVGDCSSNHLLNVRKSAKELMRVALQSKENASILEDVHPVSKDIHTLIKCVYCIYTMFPHGERIICVCMCVGRRNVY